VAELYRLQLASDHEVKEMKYFEDRTRFKEALMDAYLEIETSKGASTPEQRLTWLWFRRKRPQAAHAGIRKIVHADQFVDDEWLRFDWKLIPPHVELSIPGRPL